MGNPTNQPISQPASQPVSLPAYQPTSLLANQTANRPSQPTQPSQPSQPSSQPTSQPASQAAIGNQSDDPPTRQPSSQPNQPTQPANPQTSQPTNQPPLTSQPAATMWGGGVPYRALWPKPGWSHARLPVVQSCSCCICFPCVHSIAILYSNSVLEDHFAFRCREVSNETCTFLCTFLYDICSPG